MAFFQTPGGWAGQTPLNPQYTSIIPSEVSNGGYATLQTWLRQNEQQAVIPYHERMKMLRYAAQAEAPARFKARMDNWKDKNSSSPTPPPVVTPPTTASPFPFPQPTTTPVSTPFPFPTSPDSPAITNTGGNAMPVPQGYVPQTGGIDQMQTPTASYGSPKGGGMQQSQPRQSFGYDPYKEQKKVDVSGYQKLGIGDIPGTSKYRMPDGTVTTIYDNLASNGPVSQQPQMAGVQRLPFNPMTSSGGLNQSPYQQQSMGGTGSPKQGGGGMQQPQPQIGSPKGGGSGTAPSQPIPQ